MVSSLPLASIPLLSLLAERPGIAEAAGFLVMGFCVVMFVLAALWLFTSVVGQLFIRRAKAVAKSTPPADSPAVEDPVELPPEEIAAMAAAITVVLERPFRIVQVRPYSTSHWSTEGRRQIFGSHQVR